MATAVENLIKNIPAHASILDVGYGGLDGVNTTNYLRARFHDVWGFSKDATAMLRYKEMFGLNDPIILGIYPQDMPQRKWDLLILDININTNLDFWSDEGLKKAWSFVNDGGYILTYIMTAGFNVPQEIKDMIKQHNKKWWDKNPTVPIVAQEQEERRPEIIWVLLKK